MGGKEGKGEGNNGAVGRYSYSAPKQVMTDLPGEAMVCIWGGASLYALGVYNLECSSSVR